VVVVTKDEFEQSERLEELELGTDKGAIAGEEGN
jgi:hypothetical protein